jgi:uncharacterized membrane protein YqaE (UPF0057 family)
MNKIKCNIQNIDNYKYFIEKLNLGKKIIKNKIIINGIILNKYTFKKIKHIIKSNKILNIEIIPKIKGGFISELFSAVINLFNLLVGIPKFCLFVLRFVLWLIQFFIYLLWVLLKILDKDGIIGLIKYLVTEIMLAPFKFVIQLIKKFVNNLGNVTIAALSGADNVKSPNEEEPTDFHSTTSKQEKCYRTSDGLIPFSVIIATILCPPIGVFMEYGISGWLNILFCALLTLLFYFPGLIYALILLYC